MEFLQMCVLATMALIALASIIKKTHKTKTQKNPAPHAAGAWPIIGHLPLLGASKLPHKVLATMSNTHGPIFSIRLGMNRALVVSTREAAYECLMTNDKAVSGRPKATAIEIIGYNYAMFGFGPYDSYWRHMRKILMLELLSNTRLTMLSTVWKAEIDTFINELHALCECNKKGVVDFKQRFADLTINIIVRIVLGKKYAEAVEFYAAISEFSKHAGTFNIGDAFPFLKWLDLGGQQKAMRVTFNKLDRILQGWLDEHKRNRPEVDQIQDFMDVMLSIIDEEAVKDYNYDVDTINKAACLTAIAGGSDSTTVTLTWAISLLLNNPHVLKRAQDELAKEVPKDRKVEHSDISRLIYLQAVVKETMRLYPAGTLMGPREFTEDCVIGGYDIRAGTRLIVNSYQIFRDPEVWEDPLVFRPERFLDKHKDVDYRGKNIEFIPFGAGRRMCPGVSFGLQVVHFALASVLHAFELQAPSNAPIDMAERFGLTNAKAKPLQVLITPRLSPSAYV